MISLGLLGTVGGQIGAACTDTDAKIKPDALVYAVIQHSGGINTTKAAAYIYSADFWGLFQVVPFYLGNARFSTSGKSLM